MKPAGFISLARDATANPKLWLLQMTRADLRSVGDELVFSTRCSADSTKVELFRGSLDRVKLEILTLVAYSYPLLLIPALFLLSRWSKPSYWPITRLAWLADFF